MPREAKRACVDEGILTAGCEALEGLDCGGVLWLDAALREAPTLGGEGLME